MDPLRRGLLAAALLLPSAAFGQGEGPPAHGAVRFRFGDGLRLSAGGLEARVRTRLHLDLTEPALGEVFGSDDAAFAPPFDGDPDFRRARWLTDLRFAEGHALEGLSARAQVDFRETALDWLDLFVRYDLEASGPVERMNVRAGQFREAFGFEAMSSVSHLPFIERSAASNAFTPGRSRGLQWVGRGSDFLVSAGHFRRADGLPFPDELLQETATTLRALWTPEEPYLTQLGASMSLRRPNGDRPSLRARPGTRMLRRIVDTGPLDAERLTTFGLEALLQRGRTSVYGEAFGAAVDGDAGSGDAWLSGGHVAIAHFITEGSQTRKRFRGGFGAPDVADALAGAGDGAVELAARASWVDLDDGPVRGGSMLGVELGVNWYVQPATRFMLHWLTLRTGEDETGSAVLARIQLQI